MLLTGRSCFTFPSRDYAYLNARRGHSTLLLIRRRSHPRHFDSSHDTITPVSSANWKCALSSALFRRVEVPLAPK